MSLNERLITAALLFLILISAGFLRFYELDKIPNGFYVDEAVSGFNAYSILKTGKDEYGKSLPIVFRLFGSYSPPLFIYLTAPVIGIFGLNVFSVRFISVISGLLMIIVIYLFLKEFNFFKKNENPVLFCTFLFSFSPWALFYSRAGYEINLGFFIFSLGCFLLFKGLKSPVLLVFGLVVLSISIYTAHVQRFLVPLLLIGYYVIFFKELVFPNTLKYLKYGLIWAIIIQIPNFMILFTPAFNSKFGLFYRDEISNQTFKLSYLMTYQVGFVLAFMRELSARMITYFSPRSLFFLPDPDLQRSIPELSVFFDFLVVPYVVGLFNLWKKRKVKLIRFILLLLFVTLIPGALTKDPFSTQRNLPFLLPIFLVISLGMFKIYQLFSYKNIFWFASFILLFLSLAVLWRSYFVLLPNERSNVWGFGAEQLANYVAKYPQIRFIIDQGRQKPMYSQLLFFINYPPEKYQQRAAELLNDNYYTGVPFNQNKNFANIELRNINWEKDIYQNQILVGDELAISENQAKEHFLTKVFDIKDPIGRIVFQGYKTNPILKCKKDPIACDKLKSN